MPTAAILAKAGHQVVGVDVNKTIVETVNQGQIHIVEPELAESVSAVESGNLFAQHTPSAADVFLIAVPTPFSSYIKWYSTPEH